MLDSSGQQGGRALEGLWTVGGPEMTHCASARVIGGAGAVRAGATLSTLADGVLPQMWSTVHGPRSTGRNDGWPHPLTPHWQSPVAPPELAASDGRARRGRVRASVMASAGFPSLPWIQPSPAPAKTHRAKHSLPSAVAAAVRRVGGASPVQSSPVPPPSSSPILLFLS
jgi:hypothetical protein